MDDGFEEIPAGLLDPRDYRLTRRGTWKFDEDIHLQEARALVGSLERLARTAYGSDQHKLFLIDNMGDALAFERCRARKWPLLSLIRRWSGLCLARNIRPAVRWIPSELNVADGASRGVKDVGYVGDGAKSRHIGAGVSAGDGNSDTHRFLHADAEGAHGDHGDDPWKASGSRPDNRLLAEGAQKASEDTGSITDTVDVTPRTTGGPCDANELSSDAEPVDPRADDGEQPVLVRGRSGGASLWFS